MSKFFAELEMYHGGTKQVEKSMKVTESAPEGFVRLVGRKLMENRSAENIEKLKPPSKIKIEMTISDSVGGTTTEFDPSAMSRREVEEKIRGRLEAFINLMSGKSTYDSSHDLP